MDYRNALGQNAFCICATICCSAPPASFSPEAELPLLVMGALASLSPEAELPLLLIGALASFSPEAELPLLAIGALASFSPEAELPLLAIGALASFSPEAELPLLVMGAVASFSPEAELPLLVIEASGVSAFDTPAPTSDARAADPTSAATATAFRPVLFFMRELPVSLGISGMPRRMTQ
ncbi:hypothetical protein [Nocardia mexicana]|uniref:Uncharacterized protein n=1 Tax=Nocardia mexicana TaxID=279262 RepID=A0A370GI72_9NOCA|nr:hypothetical protein [Nocardia mexicana]RDI42879.1 hypothetical protein DFR68_1239 [Nocardia mexicana]